MESNAWCPRLTAAMILSGSAVHVKGFGSALVSARKRLMAAWRSTTERKTPRFKRRLDSLAKKPSTALSQEHEVGVKWKTKRSCRSSQADLGMLVGGVVVEDDVDHLAGRHLGLDRVQEAHELLMAVALHVAADDGPVEDVERSEQGRGAMALVVVRHGAEPALLQRQARLGGIARLGLALFVGGKHEGGGRGGGI